MDNAHMLWMLAALIPLSIIVFILLILLMNKQDGFNFVRFYFTIIAIISIVWMAIAFWIAAYQQWMLLIISTDEYVQNRWRWEVKQCSEPIRKSIPWDEQELIDKTEAEIEQCEKDKKLDIAMQRSYDTKEATIWWLVRWIIFLILFLTHYPRMIWFQETKNK